MDTDSGKNYKNINELLHETGIVGAINYKLLEMRDKHPVFNKMWFKGAPNSTAYSGSYIVFWNDQGRLAYFNPRPEYPKGFVPIDKVTLTPVTTFPDNPPTEFARNMRKILEAYK